MKLFWHPVWEKVLHEAEKTKLAETFLQIAPVKDFQAVPIRLVAKRDGGIAATAFLCNGSNDSLQFGQRRVKILAPSGRIIASCDFEEPFLIPAESAMPWSFVFPPQSVSASLCKDSFISISKFDV